jgi:hypothetical protein
MNIQKATKIKKVARKDISALSLKQTGKNAGNKAESHNPAF